MGKENPKPLTLIDLEKYNKEVFIPELEERFVTKKEFHDFKDESLTNQDKMLKKLDILLEDKKIREYQEEKKKRLWAIVLKALKEHQILSPQDLEQIARLEIF